MFFPSLCMLGFSSLTMSFDLFCYLLSLPFFLLLLIYRTKKVFPCQATCCSMFLSWFCNTLNKNECFQKCQGCKYCFSLDKHNVKYMHFLLQKSYFLIGHIVYVVHTPSAKLLHYLCLHPQKLDPQKLFIGGISRAPSNIQHLK